VVIASPRRPALGTLEAVAIPARGSGRLLTEVERDGSAAAAIAHDARLAEEPELLRAAGAVALLAQENAQLEAAWNISLRDLRASWLRLVAAGESERRRLERDLHDGVQQRLVSLRIRLAIAGEQVGTGSYTSGPSASSGRISTKRSRSCATSPTASSRPCSQTAGGCPRCAGPSARIAACLTAGNGTLRLEVSDDGPAFDGSAVQSGDGLRNMEDRLRAVRGRLAVVSSPGGGTLVSGVVPIDGALP
jgi:signal transduction histidine kinase